MNRIYKQLEGKANQHRILVLTKMLYVIISSGQSSLSRIGAEMPGTTDVESRIKQAKRWLDSKYSAYESFFLPHIRPLLLGLSESGPLLLFIDGSEVGKGCMALMVSVVWGKRALPVCWLVRKGKKGHMSEQLHLEVLKQLSTLLPEDSEVVLLGDGERSTPDLTDVNCKHSVRGETGNMRSERLKPVALPPQTGKHLPLENFIQCKSIITGL